MRGDGHRGQVDPEPVIQIGAVVGQEPVRLRLGRAPVGVQVVSGRYREDLCLAAGEAIEAGGVPPSPIDPLG